MALSPTRASILSAVAKHPGCLAAPPPRLAQAPRDAARKSLLANGLMEPATEALDRVGAAHCARLPRRAAV